MNSFQSFKKHALKQKLAEKAAQHIKNEDVATPESHEIKRKVHFVIFIMLCNVVMSIHYVTFYRKKRKL